MAKAHVFPRNYARWQMRDIEAAFREALTNPALGPDGFNANRDLCERYDFWRNGRGWSGPKGKGAALQVQQATLDAANQHFTPVPVSVECVDRVASALLRLEADITFQAVDPVPRVGPEDEDETARDAREDALRKQEERASRMRTDVSAWWDQKKLWELMRVAVKRSRWASFGTLRLWYNPRAIRTKDAPEGERDGDARQEPETELVDGLEFGAALALVELAAPSPQAAMVFTHRDTQERAGIFRYETPEGKKEAELWYVDPESGETLLRIVHQSGGRLRRGAARTGVAPEAAVDLEAELSMGGRLPIAQMDAEPLLTEPVRRQQDALNFFESIASRIAEVAGFPERYTINAKPEGVWLKTPPANGPALEVKQDPAGGGTWYLHAVPRTLGAAITTELRGIEKPGAVGQPGEITTPQVEKFDPTDPEYILKLCRHRRQTIRETCHQGHVGLQEEATPSGVSRAWAQSDHESDVLHVKPAAEGLLRRILEGAISMAAQLSADVEVARFLEDYRIAVTLNVYTGPVSPEEAEANMSAAERGFLAWGTAMARNRVEDVGAETEAMQADPRSRLVTLRLQAEAAAPWMAIPGASLAGVARLVGLTPREVETLTNAANAGEGDPEQ